MRLMCYYPTPGIFECELSCSDVLGLYQSLTYVDRWLPDDAEYAVVAGLSRAQVGRVRETIGAIFDKMESSAHPGEAQVEASVSTESLVGLIQTDTQLVGLGLGLVQISDTCTLQLARQMMIKFVQMLARFVYGVETREWEFPIIMGVTRAVVKELLDALHALLVTSPSDLQPKG